MLVCHCAVVSDRTIRAAIADGATDLASIGRTCGAGIACGGCGPGIEELLADAGLAIREPEQLRGRQAARRRGLVPTLKPQVAGVA
jgi:bacterioferritin-associated ferredoxin